MWAAIIAGIVGTVVTIRKRMKVGKLYELPNSNQEHE